MKDTAGCNTFRQQLMAEGAFEGLRIGTLNVQNLAPCLTTVTTLITDNEIDVLCLQETCVTTASRPAMRAALAKCKLHVCFGTDMAIISKAPVHFIKATWDVAAADRYMVVAVPRHGNRPLWLVNAYGHAHDRVARDIFVQQVVEAVISEDQDYICIGDWNCQTTEGSMGRLLANGSTIACDDDYRNIMQIKPTRKDGQRVIDYAVGNCRAESRVQIEGPRDHDCIIYGFPVAKQREWSRPSFARLGDADAERVPFPTDDFNAAINDDDARRAWTLLSDYAEDVLTPDDAPMAQQRRSQPWEPVLKASSHGREKLHVPVAIRKLERSIRMCDELTQSQCGKLRKRLHYRVQDHLYGVRHDYEKWNVEFAKDTLCELLQERRERHRQDTFARHAARLAESPRLQRLWIKRAAQEETGVDHPLAPADVETKALTPQDLIAQQETFWCELWNREHPASAAGWDDLDGLCEQFKQHTQHIPEEGYECPAPVITAEALIRRAKQARHKAAGPDGWTAADLLKLPSYWWDGLSDVWRLVLGGSDMPATWSESQIALLRKTDGSHRPLGIANIAWRLGASIIVQQLASWTAKWTTAEVSGGVAGRGLAACHSRLQQFLADDSEDRKHKGVISEDLLKGFDSVHPAQATAVMKRLGLHDSVVQLLKSFYTKSRRMMASQGRVHTSWTRTELSLLQGCPFSPMSLNAIMSLWTHMVKAKGVTCCAFLDDRSYWQGGDAVTVSGALQQTFNDSRNFDKTFGFRNNDKKFQTMGNSEELRGQLDSWKAEQAPNATKSLKTLGLLYTVSDLTATAFHVDVPSPMEDRARAKLARISSASRCLTHRVAHVACLALPVVTWAAAMADVCKRAMNIAQDMVAAVYGHGRQSASKFLVWTTMLKGLHPANVCQRRAVGALWQWMRYQAVPPKWMEQLDQSFLRSDIMSWNPAVQALRGRLQLENGNMLFRIDGVWRTVMVGWDSLKTAYHWTNYLWRQDMFAKEQRVAQSLKRRNDNDPDTLASGLTLPAPPAGGDYNSGAHEVSEVGYDDAFGRAIRTMSGLDVWHGTRRTSSTVTICKCGKRLPSAAHLIWNCSSMRRHTRGLAAPRDRAAERLLLRRIEPKPLPIVQGSTRDDAHDIDTTRAWKSILAAAGQKVYLATDGGYASELATYGISIADANDIDGVLKVGGVIALHEHTSFSGECWAAYQAVRSLEFALAETRWEGDICWVLDCKGVIDMMEVDDSTDRFAWHDNLMRRIRRIRELGVRLQWCWVPSHGKHVEGWHPPPGEDEATLRAMNAAADTAATEARERTDHTALHRWCLHKDACLQWQRQALAAAVKIGREYAEHLNNDAA
eukprot:TRINITY_DN8264_c0_g1_i1.p1 TRINITY_DN8264_c0_g1~~TRINITY_DN8264_c0_g1_i1.p1  ORF type:complete len:1339 (+),score=203.71 TRINITY_DN8264_c0_g1_i1:1133-5149(+)